MKHFKFLIIMAKCTLPAGLESLSGTIQNFADGSKLVCRRYASGTRIYLVTPDSYKRKTPPSDKELRSRSLFAKANAETTRCQQAGDRRRRQVIFHEVYQRIKNEGKC